MENKIYNVAYVTSSRADYGIVRNYLNFLNKDSHINLSLLVTGSHLEKKFGYTIDNIIKDGFKIDNEISLNMDSSTNSNICNSMAIGLKKFGEYFCLHKYDLVILLGDRYEMLSVAIAASINNIPILHLHGGEVTFGNYDEFIRHSITKMSRYHFTSTSEYRNRVIQLGENPENVFNLGALGAENCRNIDTMNVRSDIKKLTPNKYFVIAFHPETLTHINVEEQAETILNAISKENYKFIFIGSNADTNSNIIRNKFKKIAKINSNFVYIENLNADSYLYLLKNAIALIGNSSSGIIEAPSLNTFTINIGDRQKGRIYSNSTINIKCDVNEIRKAIHTIIQKNKKEIDFFNPYFQENTAKNYYFKTKELLKKNIVKPKEFYDII